MGALGIAAVTQEIGRFGVASVQAAAQMEQLEKGLREPTGKFQTIFNKEKFMKYYHCVLLLCGVVILGCSSEKVEEVSMPEFVHHVRTGSLLYEEKKIKIRARVVEYESENVILLESNDRKVFFSVKGLKNAYSLW